jgi:hypothetical protein
VVERFLLLFRGSFGYLQAVQDWVVSRCKPPQSRAYQAELQGLTPEVLAQQLLLGELRAQGKRSRRRDMDNESLHAAALPRGSLQRVLTTLELIDTLLPSDTPPPSREEVDAHLERERASWESSDGV